MRQTPFDESGEPFWLGPVRPEERAAALEFAAWDREGEQAYDAERGADDGSAGLLVDVPEGGGR